MSSIGFLLDGFTMEYNKYMICCGMNDILELGFLVVGILVVRLGLGVKRIEGLLGVRGSVNIRMDLGIKGLFVVLFIIVDGDG